MFSKIIKITTITSLVLFLSACGGGSSENWGIDNGVSLPKCSNDKRDASAAIKVPAETIIKALQADTTVRVWHYGNGAKLVCTITGNAVISGDNK